MIGKLVLRLCEDDPLGYGFAIVTRWFFACAMATRWRERWERCQWQMKRPERVAAVDS